MARWPNKLKLHPNKDSEGDEAEVIEEEEEETDAKNPDTADKEQTVPTPVNGFDEAVEDLVNRMRDRAVLNETDDQGYSKAWERIEDCTEIRVKFLITNPSWSLHHVR